MTRTGVVDSTASSHLREALKEHKNYPKLPAQIQAYINAPIINLAKIAGYRALLGMDNEGAFAAADQTNVQRFGRHIWIIYWIKWF